MSDKFENAIEEMQEMMRRMKEMYEAANPESSFEEWSKSEENQADVTEFLDFSAETEALSITELFVKLRTDYETALESGEQMMNNSIQAIVHTLIERQQIEKLREEYTDDETFLGYINQIGVEIAVCFRALDELMQTIKLDADASL